MNTAEIMMIGVGVGGVLIVTGLLAAKEYNSEMKGPTRISGNWWASSDPRWRDSKYRWTDTDRGRRTRVRNQDIDFDPNSDYEAIAHRPSRGWSGGKSKRKTRRNKN
jgi:hypothetical protein